ncbi:MAG: hypothetical protein IT449_17610 [Phycisphaerales bacterium]|nr:hypothetical protein [Phycisphaerales bacterium]
MIDFARVTTPRGDGEVLLLPPLQEWPRLVEQNQATLAGSSRRVLDLELSEVRRRARACVRHDSSRPLIVTGHQPEFIHAGVWAKHIAASELALRTSGAGLNLIVDHDVPRDSELRIPRFDEGAWRVEPVRAVHGEPGSAYEFLPPLGPDELTRMEQAVASAMGGRWGSSQMPAFFEAARRCGATAAAADFVDQMTAGRKGVERRFGIDMAEVRTSALPWHPFVADVLLSASRFAIEYNRALGEYRARHHVRGRGRPMPDLASDAEWQEVPLWLLRRGRPRRRCFVKVEGDALRLRAEDENVGRLSASLLARSATCAMALAELGDWSLRPKALALTLWARLFLADFFIHGTGGAKYDRITDDLVRAYYGLTPPAYACVSATLRYCEAEGEKGSAESARDAGPSPRELRFNPQRFVNAGAEVAPLLAHRAEAIRQSADLRRSAPRDRSARRRAFERIRRANAELAAQSSHVGGTLDQTTSQPEDSGREAPAAAEREFFFALFDGSRLRRLMDSVALG